MLIINLIISVHRFYSNFESSANNFQKKQNYIRFPINDFNVNDYTTRSVKISKTPTTYNLCAVSNHYGNMERGHYTAFCKNVHSKW